MVCTWISRRRQAISRQRVWAGALVLGVVMVGIAFAPRMANAGYVCGDGYIAPPGPWGLESCDDQNNVNGDGCTAGCLIEPGWSCVGEPSVCTILPTPTPAPTATPTPAPTATPAPSPTPTPVSDCGDGARQTGGCTDVKGQGIVFSCEECDDGNTAAGDGCDATCNVEAGWSCTGYEPDECTQTATPTPAPTPTPTPTPAPTATPTPAPTATPAPSPTPTPASDCGDGARQTGGCTDVKGQGIVFSCEECDDGNTAAGDGCDATCNVEAGWSCTGYEPDECTETATPTPAPTPTPEPTATPEPTPEPAECGNGLVETETPGPSARGGKTPEEECDDGNTEAGDGCDGSCVIEEGYTCEGEPSDCFLSLGIDRIVLWPAFQDYGVIIARGHTGGVVPLDVDGGLEIVVRDAGPAPGLGQEVSTSFTAAECVADRRGGFICADEDTPSRLVNRVRIVQDRRSGGYKIKVYLGTTVMELGLYGPAEMDIVTPSGATYRGEAPNCRGGVPPEERLLCLGGVS